MDCFRKASIIFDGVYFMLIYIISLMLRSVIDITISNQSSSIKLTSPVYFIKDTNCHIQFLQQVDPRNITRVNFMTGLAQDTFGGALLYHLQRKKGTSISALLLVIWGYNSDGIYSHTWIIKHESTLVWDKEKLKRLHDAYDSRRDEHLNIGRWELDDNTKLRTRCEISHGGFEMKIIISRKREIFYATPPRVDPNR
jgi:hypothetical protein